MKLPYIITVIAMCSVIGMGCSLIRPEVGFNPDVSVPVDVSDVDLASPQVSSTATVDVQGDAASPQAQLVKAERIAMRFVGGNIGLTIVATTLAVGMIFIAVLALRLALRMVALVSFLIDKSGRRR